MVKSKVSPDVPMSCSTLSCLISHPNRLVAGRAFSHLMGVQVWDYHQTKQEAAAEKDTHPVNPLVLEAGSTHPHSCRGSVPGPLAVQATFRATSSRDMEQGRHFPLFLKFDCLDEASAMWGLALAFRMAPFHLPRTAFQKHTPWHRGSSHSIRICWRAGGGTSVCSQGKG